MIKFLKILPILALTSCAQTPRVCGFGDTFTVGPDESGEVFLLQDAGNLPAEIADVVSEFEETTVAAWYRSDYRVVVYTWNVQRDMRAGDVHRFSMGQSQYEFEESLSWICNDELRNWEGPN